jgi:NADH-quinone oxidoreductase subunit J
MHVIVYLSAAAMLLCGIYAVVSQSILRSAIGLAFSSAALALLLYDLGAPWASVLELSVCSGLVTIIFISGISLSRSPKLELLKEYRDHERNRALPIALVVLGMGLVVLALSVGADAMPISTPRALDFKTVFWQMRQTDIWGQIAAILCGGIAVAVLFREER